VAGDGDRGDAHRRQSITADIRDTLTIGKARMTDRLLLRLNSMRDQRNAQRERDENILPRDGSRYLARLAQLFREPTNILFLFARAHYSAS